MSPELSIIIINYNTQALTEACIESIYRHRGELALEVILLDNASEDGSKAHFSALAEAGQWPGFRYQYNLTNLGFSRACNQGAAMASGAQLFFLNSDTEWQNNVGQTLLEALTANPEAGIVGPRFANSDGSLQVSCRDFPSLGIGLLKFFPFLKPFLKDAQRRYYQGERDYNKAQAVDTVSAGALLIPAQLFEAIGGFDEFSFMYGEDADICRQVRDTGRQIWFIPAAKLLHHGGQSSQLNSSRAIWSYYLAFYQLYKKYYFGPWAMLLKPLFIGRALLGLAQIQFKRDKRVTWNNG
ncbi:MAG: glycosyltransferase family 2 protein [Cellvibrionaceae bacterium]|nr:glycosyltransferase family 2 protein [Cellvibrionaceae bacterium]MCV6625510.1 glycosyltransferase family 2 protein [Cellvibrionaceae bacterium]